MGVQRRERSGCEGVDLTLRPRRSTPTVEVQDLRLAVHPKAPHQSQLGNARSEHLRHSRPPTDYLTYRNHTTDGGLTPVTVEVTHASRWSRLHGASHRLRRCYALKASSRRPTRLPSLKT